MKSKPEKWVSPIPIPPGETIKEMLVAEFSRKTKLTLDYLNKLIAGESEVTGYVAYLLSRDLGNSHDFWLGLEESYRKSLAKQEADNGK